MKINHTHTLYELYHLLTSSARSQLARVDSSSDVKQNQRGTGRGVGVSGFLSRGTSWDGQS